MPTLRLDADAKAGVKAFDDLAKAVEKVDDKLEITNREAKKLEVQAKRIVESNLGPQERYNKKLEELAKHVKVGTLSMAEAEKQAAKYGQRLDEAGRAGEKSFGASALSGIASLATGWLSVGTAVSAVLGTLQKVSEENRRVSESFYSGLGSVGELQQVSNTPEDFRKNLGFARSLVRDGVFNDIGAAADFTFATTSAGYTDAEKAYLKGIGEKKIVKGEGLTGFAAGARKVQKLYPGESLESVGDKLLAASGLTQANITQTAEAVPALTAMAKALKYNPDEVFAALVANEEAAPSISEGATQQRSLLTAVMNKNLSKGSLMSTVDELRQRELAGENISQLLGSTEAFAGYSALINERGEYDLALKNIRGSAGGIESRNFTEVDPIAKANFLKAKTKGAMDATIEQQSGERVALAEAVYNDIIANSKGGFQRGMLTFSVGTQANFAGMTGREDAFLREQLATDDIGGKGGYLSPGVRSSVEDYLRRIAEASERNSTQPATRPE